MYRDRTQRLRVSYQFLTAGWRRVVIEMRLSTHPFHTFLAFPSDDAHAIAISTESRKSMLANNHNSVVVASKRSCDPCVPVTGTR